MPSDWLGGWDLCLVLLPYTYIVHIQFWPHASSSGGFRREHFRYFSAFYWDKREVHQGIRSLQTQRYQRVKHYLQQNRNAAENHTTYATHTEIGAANQLIFNKNLNICTTSKRYWHWLVNCVHYHRVQTYVTYYNIAKVTLPRTVYTASPGHKWLFCANISITCTHRYHTLLQLSTTHLGGNALAHATSTRFFYEEPWVFLCDYG